MEPNVDKRDKGYFVVTRAKARNSFRGAYQGSVGRVESETAQGELVGRLLGGGRGSSRGGVTVKKGDAVLLSRYQAQLLLFVSPPKRRLEVLIQSQLFAAICGLAQNDLVVVRHGKGCRSGLVRNLMQIGCRDRPADLLMLGFEVEFLDTDEDPSSRKPPSLPVFSAGDIVQVMPANQPSRSLSGSPPQDEKVISRGILLPKMQPLVGVGGVGGSPLSHDQPPVPPRPLEIGSMVEVWAVDGGRIYGVVRWMGTLAGVKGDWAGIELDYEVKEGSDGRLGSQRYFTCRGNRGLFLPLSVCRPDSRFLCMSPQNKDIPLDCRPPPETPEDGDIDVTPVSESRALSLLEGKMKGIQGHSNSCYLDATLFSLFSTSMILDDAGHSRATSVGHGVSRVLRKDIINRLRRQGYVPAESVMALRRQLGCGSFLTEEKDPEEFITALLPMLGVEPLLKIRSNGETTQEAYTFQIILDKVQVTTPTVQELLDASFVSCDLKFEEVPTCLIVQMPRFGKKYKMFPQIIPSVELDVTDLLHNSPRECFLCGHLAGMECSQCLQDRRLQPGRIKQYCSTCSAQVHAHPLRQDHRPRKLAVPPEQPANAPAVYRQQLQLLAVLCIHTSHYVAYVKYGPAARSWLFFDSMADRCGDDENGFNVPEVRSCPEVGDFLSCPEEELVHANLAQAGEPVRRLLCDSYMFLYQNPAKLPDR